MTKNIYSFEPLPNGGQSRIRVTRPTGDCLVLTFNSSYPLQVSDVYMQAIEIALKKHPEGTLDDYFGLFTRFFAQNNLVMPQSIGLDRDAERIRIGARIKEIREKRQLSALQLAIKANIDPANLCRIEQGRYSAGLDILSKIASALGSKLDIVEL